jgi:hypothetical protein
MKRRTIQPRMRRRRKAAKRDTLRREWDLHLFSVGVGHMLLEYSKRLKAFNDAITEAIHTVGEWRDDFEKSLGQVTGEEG